MGQEQVQRQLQEQTPVEDLAAVDAEAQAEKNARAADVADELKGKLDDLLDEVDLVLEENAEEFVHAYVQKGGE